MFRRLVLLAVMAAFIANDEVLSENVCSSINIRAISLAVRSVRNSTGHRHISTDVVLRGANGRRLTDLGDVGIEVSQSSCTTNAGNHLHFTTALVVPEMRVPPSGYELVPRLGWYRLYLQPLTWEEARLACEAEGAHLAVLNSPEEAAALKKISDEVPKIIPGSTWSDEIFVGFSDSIEGQYVTIFGETLSQAGYAEWHPGQPDNLKTNLAEKQDCGSFVRSTGKLNDSTCKAKLAYFCEISN